MNTKSRLASLLSMGGLTQEAKERLEAIVAEESDEAVVMAEASRQLPIQQPRVGVVRDSEGFIVPARPPELRAVEIAAPSRSRPFLVAAEQKTDAAVTAIPLIKEEYKMNLVIPVVDKLPAVVVGEPSVPCSVLSVEACFTANGIESKSDFIVEGAFQGKISCRTLTVLAGGNVEGEIYVQTLKNSGSVSGKISADTVLLYKGSTIMGDVKCKSFGAQPDTVIRARIDCESGMQSIDAALAESQREPANVGRRDQAIRPETDFDLGGRVEARG